MASFIVFHTVSFTLTVVVAVVDVFLLDDATIFILLCHGLWLLSARVPGASCSPLSCLKMLVNQCDFSMQPHEDQPFIHSTAAASSIDADASAVDPTTVSATSNTDVSR